MVVVENEDKIMGVTIERPHVTESNDIIWEDATLDFFPAYRCFVTEYQKDSLQNNLAGLKHLYQTLYEIYQKSSSPRCIQELFGILVREYGIWGMFPYIMVIDKNIGLINTLFMNAADEYRQEDVIVDLKGKIHMAVMKHSDIIS